MRVSPPSSNRQPHMKTTPLLRPLIIGAAERISPSTAIAIDLSGLAHRAPLDPPNLARGHIEECAAWRSGKVEIIGDLRVVI